jgi:hypothetical protein
MRPLITPGPAVTSPAAESAVTLFPLPLANEMSVSPRDTEAHAIDRLGGRAWRE